jgi:Uncharacterized protein conserved in bacteria (DUF2252)
VIDLNDFDEAHPGGWEWDLRRLAASFWVAGRHNGTSEQPCGNAVRSCVASYRHELRRLADLPLFTRSFVRLDVDRLAAETAGPLSEQVAQSALLSRCGGHTDDDPLRAGSAAAGTASGRLRSANPSCPSVLGSFTGAPGLGLSNRIRKRVHRNRMLPIAWRLTEWPPRTC